MSNARFGRTALATGIAFVSLSAVAPAKTNTLTGEFQNDDNGTVEIKVAMKKVKKGKFKPKAIASVQIAGLDFFCLDGEEGELARSITGPFPITKESGFEGTSYSFDFDVMDEQDGAWNVRSLPDSDGINSKGTFSRGSIEVEFQQPAVPGPGQTTCGTGSSNIYTAEK